MKAIVLKDFGSTDNLKIEDVAEPVAGIGEVLIDVTAIGVNPVDAKTRNGKGQAQRIKNDPPMILGWDISGTVISCGEGVSDFKAGDEVFGMINIPGHGKGYAHRVVAAAAHVALKPANISHHEAAAAGIAAVTAWQALKQHMNVQAGQRILIHAAAGGVGHYAVQMARYLGAKVVGSASPDNHKFISELGCSEYFDYRDSRWEEKIEPVDFVLETIGGDNIERSLRVLRTGGTIVSLPSGKSEDVSAKAAAQNKKGVFFTVTSNSNDINAIAQLLKNEHVRSHISNTYQFHEFVEAHQQIERGKTRGKIVIMT